MRGLSLLGRGSVAHGGDEDGVGPGLLDDHGPGVLDELFVPLGVSRERFRTAPDTQDDLTGPAGGYRHRHPSHHSRQVVVAHHSAELLALLWAIVTGHRHQIVPPGGSPGPGAGP